MRFPSTCGRRTIAAGVTLGLAFAFSSCGRKGGSPAPTAPSQNTTPTPAPVAATPTPAPAPSTGPGLSAACRALAPPSGSNTRCQPEGSGHYAAVVSAAVDGVDADYRNGNEVTYVGGYLQDIIQALDAQGYCAVPEADNLFVRKTGDDFNEYYDILTSRGDVSKRYTNTCRPSFATPALPPPPPQRDPTCHLPPSSELLCTTDHAPLFGEEVREAIEAVVADDRARPTQVIFDFSQRLGGTADGWKVIDAIAYHNAVLDKLRQKGFCGYYDSEEIQVKNSNRVSAHWDIYKAEGFRIQLWAGICRDAAF